MGEEGCEGSSQEGGPQSVSHKGWKQCSVRGAWELSCSEGSAGEKPARNWASWKEERGRRVVERQGAGARPRASHWGNHPGPGFPGGWEPRRGGYWEGAEGKVPRCLRQRGVCAGGEPGKTGGLTERSGSLWGEVGGGERREMGKPAGGGCARVGTRWDRDWVMVRECCRERKLRGPGLAPHPQRGGDLFPSPRLLPQLKETSALGSLGWGVSP